MVSQDSVSDNGSIKYFLVSEDGKKRVEPSQSDNSVHISLLEQPLSLQQRLTSSDEFGDVNKDLIISWDELFMGLALLEKKFINLNDKDPSKKVE